MTPAVELVPFRAHHLATLAVWLRRPHVAPWFPEPEANLAWAGAVPPGGDQAIIAAGGVEVGYLRWQRVSRETLDELGFPDIPAGSVDADILLGEDAHVGRGIGPAALVALADELGRDGSVAMLGLTTSVENGRAHRAFAKAGFRISRQYDPNGLGLCHLMLLDLRPSRGWDGAGGPAENDRRGR